MKWFVHQGHEEWEQVLLSLIKSEHEVVGSVPRKYLDKEEEYGIKLMSDTQKIKREILEADVIVHRLKHNTLDDTRYAIKILEGAEYYELKTFIMITNAMSWSNTPKQYIGEEGEAPPVDETEVETENVAPKPEKPKQRKPFEPFTEDIYVTRKPHQRFASFVEVEKRLKRAQHKYLRPFIIYSGILYGNGEDYLHPFFKEAWSGKENLTCYLDGDNYLPMIHCSDLASIVRTLAHKPPSEDEESSQSYFFAVDSAHVTLKTILKTIAKEFQCSDSLQHLEEHDLLLHDNVEELTNDVKFQIGAVNDFEMEWKCKEGFVEHIKFVRYEFEMKRKLSPLKLNLIGPPGVGKSTIAKYLSKHYKIPYLLTSDVIKEYFEQQPALEMKLETLQKNKPATEEGEGEEDPAVTSIKKLLEEINTIKVSGIDDNNRLNDASIAKIFQWKLLQKEYINKGWILDGFPKTLEQAKQLSVRKTGGEEESEEGPSASAQFVPEYIISLRAKTELLEDRVSKMPVEDRVDVVPVKAAPVATKPDPKKKGAPVQEVVKLPHNSKENFAKRLQLYNQFNPSQEEIQQSGDPNQTIKNSILGYYEQLKSKNGKYDQTCLIKEIFIEDDNQLEEYLTQIKNFVGEPHNYGLTEEEMREIEDKKRQEEEESNEKLKSERAATEAQKQHEEAEEAARRKRDEERLEEIRQQELQVLEAKTQPLRGYLMKNVIPIITQGLVEVVQVKPDDPIDYLAEYLFKFAMQQQK